MYVGQKVAFLLPAHPQFSTLFGVLRGEGTVVCRSPGPLEAPRTQEHQPHLHLLTSFLSEDLCLSF